MYLPHETDTDRLDQDTAQPVETVTKDKSMLWRIIAGGLLVSASVASCWWWLKPASEDGLAEKIHAPDQLSVVEQLANDVGDAAPSAPGDEVFNRLTGDQESYITPIIPMATDAEFQLAEATASISDQGTSYRPIASDDQDTTPSYNPEQEYLLPTAPLDDTGSQDDVISGPAFPLTSDGNDGLLPLMPAGQNSGLRLPGDDAAGSLVDQPRDFAASEPQPFPSVSASDGLQPEATSAPNAPGRFQLEGNQLPSLSIQKYAPPEVQVNRTAIFSTTIKNVGKVAAHQVRVLDYVPRGTRFESSSPKSTPLADGGLVWQLGTLQPGEEASLSMKVIPQREGEIGSVARVDFQAQASVRTVSTRPQLVLHQSAAERVLVGEETMISITISNPGSGDATGVVVETDIPAELAHAAGRELEYPIGTLRAGETRQLKLKLRAASAGRALHAIVAHGEGQLLARHDVSVEVIAPELKVGIQGPRLRYLDRPATHVIQVVNTGTASAHNISLMMQLPAGLKYVSTDHHGRYEARQHAVYWQLEELPANVQDSVKLTTLPVSAGEHVMRLSGNAELGIIDHHEHMMRVESVPQLMFTIADKADPIEQGSDTTYMVRIVNKGTRTATNVVVTALLPTQMQAINGDGPTDARIDNGQISFAPLDRLAPKAEAIYQLQIRGVQAGDHVIRVQVVSDDTRVPVAKEESTRVYADN